MAKQKITRNGCTEDGTLYSWLTYAPGDYEVIEENPSPTLEELANFCDQNAESRNNHDFVGSHRLLAAMLIKQLGREIATDIMFEIAEYGGLDGASGLYWQGGSSAFDDFGIEDCWVEWSLEPM